MRNSDAVARASARPAHARSVAIEPPAELLDHLAPGGFAWLDSSGGFVASGVAAVVDPGDARALLARIDHTTTGEVPADAGPRAVGALPFAGHGRLVVPQRVVGCTPDGRAWCTEIEGLDTPVPLRVAAAQPSEFAVRSATNRDEWCTAVERVLTRIDAGAVEKVVLARAVTVEADVPFDARAVLTQLHRTQPGCVIYGHGGFVGASPELLVRKQGRSVVSRPLAGTGLDPAALARSAKDGREHRIVVDAVVRALASCCHDVDADGPHALQFANVTHLATTVRAVTNDHAVAVTDIVRALHPTPAVAGAPAANALELIDELEATPRGRYAGPCGWIDAHGDGAFVVALRGAELDGARATLHAGAGIVRGSVPETEWAETQQKLTPMLQALVRP